MTKNLEKMNSWSLKKPYLEKRIKNYDSALTNNFCKVFPIKNMNGMKPLAQGYERYETIGAGVKELGSRAIGDRFESWLNVFHVPTSSALE